MFGKPYLVSNEICLLQERGVHYRYSPDYRHLSVSMFPSESLDYNITSLLSELSVILLCR